MTKYRIKGGPSFTGMPASFIGIIRATHVHELNGREMVNMEMMTPEGKNVFSTCWLYWEDLEEVTND
jgi:hypothetical protein